MKKKSDSFGTYRCPVCGHGDTIELTEDAAPRQVDCSYCGAALEVGERDPKSGRLNTRLVEDADGG